MGSYSKDLRPKVLAATDRGAPRREVVHIFGVSLATLKRWLKKRREGEDLATRFSSGRKRRILSSADERGAYGPWFAQPQGCLGTECFVGDYRAC